MNLSIQMGLFEQPYFPDLAPSDFALFPYLKGALKFFVGCRS